MVDSARLGQGYDTGSAARGDGRTRIWSTDGVPSRERFSYWREVVCSAAAGFFGTPTAAPPGEFSARATLRSCGPFRFLVGEAKTSYQLALTRRDAANMPSDHYGLFVQLSGETMSIRGEETTRLSAGEIGFCLGGPYRGAHGGRSAIAMLPRAMIERRAPWLRNLPYRKLAANARFVDHVRLHMMELAGDGPPLDEAQTSLLADNLCNLMALAAAGGMPATRLQGELQLEALLAFCRQHLQNPDLSPQRAADAVGISLRTLHSRFRQTGRSFGHWVLEARLDGCSAALRDPHQRQKNISELAYQWGFNDLSYFNKAFRAQFGMTPGDWRNDPAAS
jgi:AraC-like DNA-binding protein